MRTKSVSSSIIDVVNIRVIHSYQTKFFGTLLCSLLKDTLPFLNMFPVSEDFTIFLFVPFVYYITFG